MGGSSDTGLRGVVWPGAWLAGIAWQLQQVALSGLPVHAACLVAGAALLIPALRLPRAGLPLGALAAALAGFGLAGLQALPRLADTLPPRLEGQDLVVTGTVTRLPQHNLTGTRFVFDIDSASLRGEPVVVPGRVSLGWYRGPDDDALLAGPSHELRAGQRWRLTVRLRQPHGSLNPGGFDLELWLFEQGIRAGGYVRSRAGDVATLLDATAGHPVERLRQTLRERIEAAVPDRAAAGVLAALAIGDQQAIELDADIKVENWLSLWRASWANNAPTLKSRTEHSARSEVSTLKSKTGRLRLGLRPVAPAQRMSLSALSACSNVPRSFQVRCA